MENSFPGVKRPRIEADRSPLYIVGMKKWSFTSTPHITSWPFHREHFTLTKTDQLLLFRIMHSVCCDYPTERINSLPCVAEIEFLNVKAGGTCNYHYTLKVNEAILAK
jgi:hypothetical protein